MESAEISKIKIQETHKPEVKKRGRKPKNPPKVEDPNNNIKKRRGRRRKYEIDNYQRLLNKSNTDVFDHKISYSDEEMDYHVNNDLNTVSFGNLNITVQQKNTDDDDTNLFRKNLIENVSSHLNNEEKQSMFAKKKIIEGENIHGVQSNGKSNGKSNERSIIIKKSPNSNIDINEYSDDEWCKQTLADQNQFEKVYRNKKVYIPKEDAHFPQVLNRVRVVHTLQNFIQESKWPESTDVYCWWCCHPFDNIPLTLPLKHDCKRNRFTFNGVFCSWNCVKAYNFNMPDSKIHERNYLITIFKKKLENMVVNNVSIVPAPPRQSLKIFGGYMDIETFRSKAEIATVTFNEIGFTFLNPCMEEISKISKISKIKEDNESKIKFSRGKNNSLRLHRK